MVGDFGTNFYYTYIIPQSYIYVKFLGKQGVGVLAELPTPLLFNDLAHVCLI
jgi:hypothetical protein